MTRHPFPLALLLLLGALAARAEFAVTPERPLAPTLGMSRDARVVATDAGFLAFWRTKTTYGGEGLAQIARFSRDGQLERRTTAWLLPDTFEWYDAASNGQQVLLSGVMTGELNRRLAVARFTAAGDYAGLTLLPLAQPVAPVLASDGDNFLLTVSLSQTKEVVAIPVSGDGVAGEPFVLGAWDPYSQWTSAAAIGGTYFAAWGAPGGHVLTRISGLGFNATVPLAPPFEISQVRIESSGDRLLVVVSPLRANDPTMHAAIFDAGLAQLTGWFRLEGATAMPLVAATANGWIVGAAGAGRAVMIPVARDGSIGAPGVVADISTFLIDAAARGDRAALVWTASPNQTVPEYTFNAVRLAMFDAAGASVRGPATISLGPVAQIHPAAAHAGSVSLVAWVERTLDERFLVRARAFDGEGTPLAAAVTMPSRGGDQTRPVVASDGSSFLVAWSERSGALEGINAARVDVSGRVLDDASIEIFADLRYRGGSKAGVDWNGSSWIVATGTAEWQIVAKRVSPGGVVVDLAPREISDSGSNFDPVVECNDDGACLVAWHGPPDSYECHITCVGPGPSIVAKRIHADLSLIDATPIRLSGEYASVSDLDVSWSEAQGAWLVAWSPTGTRRIARHGSLLDAPGDLPVESSGFISVLPERGGWRLVWSASSGVWQSMTRLFHGWSATGSLLDVESRVPLTGSIEHERDPQLVGEHRRLAFFQRESQISAGSPAVLGQCLDAAAEPVATTLTLSARPVADRRVRLAWTTDIADVSGFTIYSLRNGWQSTARLGRQYRTLDVGYARAYRIVASTPSGPVQSNIVEVPALRVRTIVR